MINPKQRTLEKLSFRYYLKDKLRSSEENWELANKLLEKLGKRYANK